MIGGLKMQVLSLIDEALEKLEDGNYIGCGNTLKKLKDDVIKANLDKELNIINDLENDIKCVGFQNNPYPYMNGANCFVLSSRNEGLPNVLLEAQYLGIPSAATSCIPMIKRIVVDDVNGYLAAVDDADSLATAMLNAARLKSIKSTYQPASINDVLNVFK